MNETGKEMIGTAGGVVGAVGGISCGMLLIAAMLITLFCIIPSICLIAYAMTQPPM